MCKEPEWEGRDDPDTEPTRVAHARQTQLKHVRPLITVNLAPTCRNGHVKTSANTYRSKSGHERCRDCRRKHRPLKVRPCAQCRELFSGFGKRCPACLAVRPVTALEEAKTPLRTRTCAACHEVQPLESFRLTVADFQQKGAAQFSERCLDCREDEEFASSPYERAKQQIVRIFHVPAKEWMNRPGHVLSDLHFLRMLAIQYYEARRTGGKPVRVEIDTTRSRLLFDRLRGFLHQPGAVATTYTLRAA